MGREGNILIFLFACNVTLGCYLLITYSPGISKVLHVRNVSPETSHEELVAFVSQFGSVVASMLRDHLLCRAYFSNFLEKFAFCPSFNKLL